MLTRGGGAKKKWLRDEGDRSWECDFKCDESVQCARLRANCTLRKWEGNLGEDSVSEKMEHLLNFNVYVV